MGDKLKRFVTRRPARDDDGASDLRTRAVAAEQGGQIRVAIEAWTEVNRLQPDPRVEEHLVKLRCDHALSTPPGVAINPWPRRFEDPFPDVSGQPPEIDAEQLAPELLGGAIEHHGCLIVRRLFPQHRIEVMRDTIDRVLAGRKDHLADVPVAETTPWYAPCASWDAFTPEKAHNHRRFTDAGRSAVHACDSPRASFQIAEALEEGPVLPMIADYLGERPVLSANKTMLRRVPPDAKPSWHQDGSFMGQQARTVNVWVALSDCGDGREAPGLAIVPRPQDESIRGEVSNGDIVLTADQLDQASGGVQAVRPAFAPGDALLFDELLVHANGGGQPGLCRPRYAVEAWLFAPTSLPEGYLPMSVG
ncbi:MAG: phytanoyl-CoA dioxygenase family protein [Acidimicrobiales bacterium]